MQYITTLDGSAYQQVSYILDDGTECTLTLRFMPTQNRWVLDVSDDSGFEVHGIFLCCHPNLLDKWHNIIKYGINITTSDGIDPFRQNDFETGYAYIAILNADETVFATEYLNGLYTSE